MCTIYQKRVDIAVPLGGNKKTCPGDSNRNSNDLGLWGGKLCHWCAVSSCLWGAKQRGVVPPQRNECPIRLIPDWLTE